MKDKDILNMLGLNDRTITLTADDEYLQIMLEKKIDNYLKKLDEEKKKQEQIDYYKNQYEKFQKKNEFVKKFEDKYINKIKKEFNEENEILSFDINGKSNTSILSETY